MIVYMVEAVLDAPHLPPRRWLNKYGMEFHASDVNNPKLLRLYKEVLKEKRSHLIKFRASQSEVKTYLCKIETT